MKRTIATALAGLLLVGVAACASPLPAVAQNVPQTYPVQPFAGPILGRFSAAGTTVIRSTQLIVWGFEDDSNGANLSLGSFVGQNPSISIECDALNPDGTIGARIQGLTGIGNEQQILLPVPVFLQYGMVCQASAPLAGDIEVFGQ